MAAESERVQAVKEALFAYVKSPSLRHIRDPYSIVKLAHEIVSLVDRGPAVWRKWNDPREQMLKSAMRCWIPTPDLRDYLNEMQGPQLTLVDVEQRMKAFEDDFMEFPNDALKSGCLELYEREKAAGTELVAAVGLLRDHIEKEEERLHEERNAQYQRFREQDRLDREQRLLSGADCSWTQLPKSQHWYCRMNGRTYRLSPDKDKRWRLFQVNTVSDDAAGTQLGTYQQRGDATKAIKQMAYQPALRT